MSYECSAALGPLAWREYWISVISHKIPHTDFIMFCISSALVERTIYSRLEPRAIKVTVEIIAIHTESGLTFTATYDSDTVRALNRYMLNFNSTKQIKTANLLS